MADKCRQLIILIFLCLSETCLSYDPDCRDVEDNCEMYEPSACRGIYEPWARQHCAAHCGYCQPTPTPPPPCKDRIPNCFEYEDDTCISPKFRKWAKTNCFKFCKFCTPAPTTTAVTPAIRTPPKKILTPPAPTKKIMTPPTMKTPNIRTPPPVRTPPAVRTPPPPVMG